MPDEPSNAAPAPANPPASAAAEPPALSPASEAQKGPGLGGLLGLLYSVAGVLAVVFGYLATRAYAERQLPAYMAAPLLVIVLAIWFLMDLWKGAPRGWLFGLLTFALVMAISLEMKKAPFALVAGLAAVILLFLRPKRTALLFRPAA